MGKSEWVGLISVGGLPRLMNGEMLAFMPKFFYEAYKKDRRETTKKVLKF